MTIAPTPRPFRTLQLSATASIDHATMGRIMVRAVEAYRRRHGPNSAKVLSSSGDSASDTGDGWSRHGWRIWWVPIEHWREEILWPGDHKAVIIVRPDVSLQYVSMQRTLYTSDPDAPAATTSLLDRLRSFLRARPVGAWSSEWVHVPTVAERVSEVPLIDPRLPASAWELTTLGDAEHLARPVRRVRATRRAGVNEDDEPTSSGYWPWLREYECLVDVATGLVLRMTGLEDGVPVGILTVDEIRVDAGIADDVFSFVPPAGTRIVRAGRNSRA